jgi:hypothetical protein
VQALRDAFATSPHPPSVAQAAATSAAVEQATPVTRISLTPRAEVAQPCVVALAGAWPPAGDVLVDPLVSVSEEPDDPQPATASAATSATASPTAPAEA